MPEKNRFPAVLQSQIPSSEISGTLRANPGSGWRSNGTPVEPVVIDRAAFNQGVNAQYSPHIGHSDVMDTVIAKGPHAVGVSSIVQTSELRHAGKITEQDVCPTLTAAAKQGDQTPLALQPMIIRRLTPRECERLQGFPDDWTLIPWKGKPIDQCPDGPRYKAIGNSWAVPCARYIGERINLVEEIKDETSKA